MDINNKIPEVEKKDVSIPDFIPLKAVNLCENNKPTRRIPQLEAKLKEKIVQKAIQLILLSIWEPIFINSSNKFMPNISIKAALRKLSIKGANYHWVIQGKIYKSFPTTSSRPSQPYPSRRGKFNEVIMKELKSLIGCEYTLRLISNSLKSFHVDPKLNHTINSDTPPILFQVQDEKFTPVLANIVLNKLDLYVDQIKMGFEKGLKRRVNQNYAYLYNQRREILCLLIGIERFYFWKDSRKIPSTDMWDQNYRRLFYVRYADEFVILITGTLSEAYNIRDKVEEFLLKDLDLKLENTKILNTLKPFMFLGARCKKDINTERLTLRSNGLRSKAPCRLIQDIPLKIVEKCLVVNRFAKYNHQGIVQPTSRGDLVNKSHYEILLFYNRRIYDLLNYYSFARNYTKICYAIWILKASCGLTLALKFKLRTLRKAFSKFGPQLSDPLTKKGLLKISNLKLD